MTKLASLAFVAALSLGMLATGADAARSIVVKAPPSTGDNTSDLCTTLCIQTGTIITNHPDCGTAKPVRTLLARELGTITIDPPPPHVTCASGKGSAALQACGEKLGSLRRVTIGQVRRVDEHDQVHLVPLCDTANRSLTEQQMNFLARGNVQGLLPAINNNDTLMAELEDNGYEANDVIGIVLARDAAVLYVSRHH